MRRLGNESWEERLQRREHKAHSPWTWFIPAMVLTVGFSAVMIVAIYRRAKRKRKLQEMAGVPDAINQNLRIAQQNAGRIQQLLDDFKKELPEQDLKNLESDLVEQPNRITKINTDMANLNIRDPELYSEVLQTKDRAEAEANLLANTQWKLGDIRQAKTRSQQMMQQLSKETFQIADVRDSSKRAEVDNLLANSRLMYNRAYQNSSMSVFDWILINELLNGSHSQVQQALQVSQAEPYVPTFSYNSSSSSVDTGSFGGGGDSGSGGDFGGGGGFSGGSGSGGSY